MLSIGLFYFLSGRRSGRRSVETAGERHEDQQQEASGDVSDQPPGLDAATVPPGAVGPRDLFNVGWYIWMI